MEKSWWWSSRAIMRRGDKWSRWGSSCWALGVIFAILGIIADAINGTLGLEATSWFLLSIALFVASVTKYVLWVGAHYLDTIEAKKEE